MHWDRTEDGETRQSLTFRELNWGRIQKHGILKLLYLFLCFFQWVSVWVKEGDAACLNCTMNPAGVKKRVGRESRGVF